jgi:hypothetical protein
MFKMTAESFVVSPSVTLKDGFRALNTIIKLALD